jgi:hypothetical protein
MNCRPRLKSHVQPLRRGPGSLQLGLCPDAGVVLDGLSDAEIALVEGLDGSLDIQTLYAVAAAAGVAAGRLSALMAALSEHHLLVDTTTDRAALSPIDEPRRHLLRPNASAVAAAYGLAGDGYDHVAARSTQHVVISGEGDLPCALADLLRVGGIGRVSVGRNAVNMLDLELRGHSGGGTHATFGSTLKLPDLVVLAATDAIRPDAGEPWLRRGIPHLPLVVQGHRVQVGPLIAGGCGPCLSCLDLHRRDRDAAWPALLSQLAPRGPLLPDPPVRLESTLTAMTVGAAAMIVHTCLDGQPVPGGLSLELSLPWPTIQNRRWFPHPLCDCTVGQGTMTG